MVKYEYTVAKSKNQKRVGVISAWYLMADLKGILMLIAEKLSQILIGSLSLKIYTMERVLYKQTKLAKNIRI